MLEHLAVDMQCEPSEHFLHHSTVAIQQLLLTALMVAGFFWTKTLYERTRRYHARISVVVIGAGPVGLLSVLIAAKNDHVRKVYLFEELHRNAIMNKPYQVVFDMRSVSFLKKFGVDFDSIEGCWHDRKFTTRVGVFQDYILSKLQQLQVAVDLRFGNKFTHSTIKELESVGGRLVVVCCDGTMGQASRILGLSDGFSQHSCGAYGAVASLDRPGEQTVPLVARKLHNLLFDLTAYGATDSFSEDDKVLTGFTFKLFGSSRHRFMTLAIPKCESPLVKTMRLVLDRSMMRNIFTKCYNTYRSEDEKQLSESLSLKHLKFSPRLFEFKVFQRLETVAYFEETDMFVIAEGDSARSYNFHTGMDINLSMKSLTSLPTFLSMATWAREDFDILNAMLFKSRHAEQVTQEFLRTGLKDTLFKQH